MIVYVESNYILEIALQQEQFKYAQKLLELSQKKIINLVIPSISIIEPYWTINNKSHKRNKINEYLNQEIKQLNRSSIYNKKSQCLSNVNKYLININISTEVHLEKTICDMQKKCEIIKFDSNIIKNSRNYNYFKLKKIDLLILTSIIEDLKTQKSDERKCFISRNSKDFDSPEIKDLLSEYGCILINNFRDGINFINFILKLSK